MSTQLAAAQESELVLLLNTLLVALELFSVW